MDKRGVSAATVIIFAVVGALIGTGSGMYIIYSVNERVSGHTLEKNYIARDLAMAIDAVYGSPYDISYTYILGDYDYNFDITKDSVSVSSNEKKGGLSELISKKKKGRIPITLM